MVDLVDGSRDKVGWTKTFRAVGTPRTRLSIALRAEVTDQIAAFRKLVATGRLPQVSAISGVPLTLRGHGRFHVDHAPAFADTADAWIATQGGLNRIPVVRRSGGGWMLANDEQADSWWEFHRCRHNAHRGLRAITAAENLNLGRHDEVA